MNARCRKESSPMRRMQRTINDGRTDTGGGMGMILADSGTSPAVLSETVWTQMEKGVMDNAV